MRNARGKPLRTFRFVYTSGRLSLLDSLKSSSFDDVPSSSNTFGDRSFYKISDKLAATVGVDFSKIHLVAKMLIIYVKICKIGAWRVVRSDREWRFSKAFKR